MNDSEFGCVLLFVVSVLLSVLTILLWVVGKSELAIIIGVAWAFLVVGVSFFRRS